MHIHYLAIFAVCLINFSFVSNTYYCDFPLKYSFKYN